MKGSRMSLPTQMAIGMVLGIAAGALTPAMGLDPSWYKPVGQLFINLVRMVVVPLVLTTLVAGAASVGDVSKLGRVAGKTLAYYLVTTAVAVVIGLVLANIFQPGSGLSISTEGLKAKDVAPPTLVDVFLNIVPINPIEALSKGNMLQIIFFALLFGFGLSVIGDKGKQVLHFFDGAAIYMGIAAIFAAEVYGIPMPLDRQLTVILLAVLASIGSMGVPGAALIMITMVFTQVGIPLEAIALVAGVDRIMDMARTTINVLGDATGALFVSKLESDFDPERGERLAAAE